MKYETLIFDLDGTISDPFVGISRSVNFAIQSLGLAPVDAERIRPMIGPPLTEIFTRLLGTQAAAHMNQLIDKYRERYASVGYSENLLYEHMPDVISRLSAAGHKLGVCTAKRADYAHKIVELFNLDSYFDFVDGGGVDITKTQQLARIIKSGVRADTAIMIGDRAGDVRAAQANSVHAAGVLWGFAGDDELKSANPEFMVASPQELQAIFT